jgi:hypothetical protein
MNTFCIDFLVADYSAFFQAARAAKGILNGGQLASSLTVSREYL